MLLVSELTWLVMTLAQEAEGEPQDGKIAVAEVIRNRMKRGFFSDGTILGTVLYPYQFSGWNTSSKNRIRTCRLTDDDPQYDNYLSAWTTAQGGSDFVKGALLYYNPRIVTTTPAWATVAAQTAVIGRHKFYMPQGW